MFAFITLLALATAASGTSGHHKGPEPRGSLEGVFQANDYPPEALEKHEQGYVQVLIKIDEAGAISDCIVEKSSGTAVLDARTCEVIRARAKFKPALDRRGRPVVSELHKTITWRIAEGVMPSDPWTSRVVIDFGPDGKAKTCRIELTGAVQPAPGQAPPACMPSELDRDVSEETRFGGAIDRMIVEQRFSPGSAASPDPAGAGEVIAGRNVLKLDIDATGKLSACKVIDKVGIAAVDDPCPRIAKQFVPRNGADGKPAPFDARMSVTTLVHLDGKRMPLTGSLQGLIRSDDYPPEALDKNEQGIVTMRLRVDPTGAVSDCIIEESSRSAVLDNKTCELMKQRAHFQPARDRDGNPIASEKRGSVEWQIASMPSEPWVSRMLLAFDTQGRQVSCNMEFEGAAKLHPDMVTPSCSDGAILLPHKLERELPGAIATVVMEQRFVLDGSSPPAIPQGDLLISRQVLDLQVDAKGKLARCRVVENSGGDPEVDPCTDTDEDYTARKGADGKAAPFKAKRITTVYLHVERVT